MSTKSVYAIAVSESQANQIVDSLTKSGFSAGGISVLFPDPESSQDFSYENHTKAPEGAMAGAAAGGVLGGAFGLLAGIGALAIPGVGPLIAAGPLFSALSAAAAGATAGGIAGALIGLGIPETEAKRYEDRIKEGNILISILAEDGEDTNRAKGILERAGAEDISSTLVAENATPAMG